MATRTAAEIRDSRRAGFFCVGTVATNARNAYLNSWTEQDPSAAIWRVAMKLRDWIGIVTLWLLGVGFLYAAFDNLGNRIDDQIASSDARFEDLMEHNNLLYEESTRQNEARFEESTRQNEARFEEITRQNDARFEEFTRQNNARLEDIILQNREEFSRLYALIDTIFDDLREIRSFLFYNDANRPEPAEENAESLPETQSTAPTQVKAGTE